MNPEVYTEIDMECSRRYAHYRELSPFEREAFIEFIEKYYAPRYGIPPNGLGIEPASIVALVVAIVGIVAGLTSTIVSLAVAAKKRKDISRIEQNTEQYLALAAASETEALGYKKERVGEEMPIKGILYGMLGLTGLLTIIRVMK
jgi:hypothetical protein